MIIKNATEKGKIILVSMSITINSKINP